MIISYKFSKPLPDPSWSQKSHSDTHQAVAKLTRVSVDDKSYSQRDPLKINEFDGLIVEFTGDEQSGKYIKIDDSHKLRNYANVAANIITAAFGIRIISVNALSTGEPPLQYESKDFHLLSGGRRYLGDELLVSSCFEPSLPLLEYICTRLLERDLWVSSCFQMIERSCMFYAEALHMSLRERNVSYALLISSLECLAASRDYERVDLIPEDDLQLIDKIKNHADFGEESANKIKSRFYQIKRQCLKVVADTLNEDRYNKASIVVGKFEKVVIEPNLRQKAVGASYDLRSSFLHSGSSKDSISEIWYKSDYSNILNNVKEKITKNNRFDKSLNLFQLNCLLQNCISNCLKSQLSISDELAIPKCKSLLSNVPE